MLRAIDDGRGELLCGCAPDLLIDGRFCDYIATHDLLRAGLIEGAIGPLGRRITARVTDRGRQILTAAE
jgi:hypothetical protein